MTATIASANTLPSAPTEDVEGALKIVVRSKVVLAQESLSPNGNTLIKTQWPGGLYPKLTKGRTAPTCGEGAATRQLLAAMWCRTMQLWCMKFGAFCKSPNPAGT